MGGDFRFFPPAVADSPPPPLRPLEAPTVTRVAGKAAGQFVTTPAGVILHGTRSGVAGSVNEEYQRTVNYVRQGAGGLGWNATIGSGFLAVHILPAAWGWNSREHSSAYLAVEFAQARYGDPITDGQVEAFCWYFATVLRAHWPSLPMDFPGHASLPAGVRDGKSDPFSVGDPRGAELVERIRSRLREAGVQ